MVRALDGHSQPRSPGAFPASCERLLHSRAAQAGPAQGLLASRLCLILPQTPFHLEGWHTGRSCRNGWGLVIFSEEVTVTSG